jgi:hypothetical protein
VEAFAPGGRADRVEASVPGHILHAGCCCGFEQELTPGFDTMSCIGYTVAYNADGSDLVTEDDATIKSKGLCTIRDPFLSDYEPGNGPEKLDKEIAEKNVAQGPFLCPRCKAIGLMLHFSGHWD